MASITREADPSRLWRVSAVKEQERAAVMLLSWTTVPNQPSQFVGCWDPSQLRHSPGVGPPLHFQSCSGSVACSLWVLSILCSPSQGQNPTFLRQGSKKPSSLLQGLNFTGSQSSTNCCKPAALELLSGAVMWTCQR